jgi:NTE family protein
MSGNLASPHRVQRCTWLFGVTSFYEMSALKNTFKKLIDFDRIDAREIRFSVTAVNVRTGDLA